MIIINYLQAGNNNFITLFTHFHQTFFSIKLLKDFFIDEINTFKYFIIFF